MFLFDLETLGIDSTCVVLSAAITHFESEDKIPVEDLTSDLAIQEYHKYVCNSCYVKFDALEQKKINRSVTPSTLDWWKKQADIPRNLALRPSANDLSVVQGVEVLRRYITDHGGNKQLVWARGSLDQMAIDSLCRSVDIEPLFMYNRWRDVRTAIDFLANTDNGYCEIKNFNPDSHVIKHDPRNDCALDIMMMLYYV